MDLPGIIVTDRNAASNYVRFSEMESGIKALNKTRVFARYWTHSMDPFDEMNHKSEKCAEVLVSERVTPNFIKGAYVANQTALEKFIELKTNLT
ncbi:MAG: hypothetical protein A2161_21745, partial [Candidatus Schekmanbacteria bacterium RBG_13_48_7]